MEAAGEAAGHTGFTLQPATCTLRGPVPMSCITNQKAAPRGMMALAASVPALQRTGGMQTFRRGSRTCKPCMLSGRLVCFARSGGRGGGGGDHARIGGAEALRGGWHMLRICTVIFLDEPTTGLDSEIALDIATSLKTLASAGRTVGAPSHRTDAPQPSHNKITQPQDCRWSRATHCTHEFRLICQA